MQPTLGGATCRRALDVHGSEMKLLFRALGRLTTAPSPAAASPPSSLSSRCATRFLSKTTRRNSGSASSSQWKARQGRDQYARNAKVQGLKSRAAFKLLEIDQKYRLFKKNQTVVDLGYAPGSWSQVALERTKPRGLIVGIDLIPAQPPRGVTSIQGDFLSPQVHKLVKDVLVEQVRRRSREASELRALQREKKKEKKEADAAAAAAAAAEHEGGGEEGLADEREGEGIVGRSENEGEVEGEHGSDGSEEVRVNETVEEPAIVEYRPSYIDMEKMASQDIEDVEAEGESERMVDVVMSDMSEPWPQTTGFMSNTLSNPYRRLMNTSGVAFRDHAGSMDLCHAALQFASDTLKRNGHFICKFYQGSEDKGLERKLRKMFAHVHRQKPDSSRKDSKEAFFVALRRKQEVTLADIEANER